MRMSCIFSVIPQAHASIAAVARQVGEGSSMLFPSIKVRDCESKIEITKISIAALCYDTKI